MTWKPIALAPRDGTPIQVQDADALGVIYWAKYWSPELLEQEGWGKEWSPGWYEFIPNGKWEDGDEPLSPSIWRDQTED